MKTRMKKISALLLGAVMTMSLFTGCGSSNGDTGTADTVQKADSQSENGSGQSSQESTAGEIDLSEHVDLKMYLLGDRTPDFDEVYGEINKILEEKLNCSISVDFLSWGEHDTKYSLLFSGGEDFDLIFTASGWAHYETTVALGGFYPLSEEFIQTYAPDIWEVVPEVAWNQAKLDGVIYMVPNYTNEFNQDTLAVRGDLMEKYGYDKIENWDDLVGFFKACAEDGQYASQGGPWYQYFQSQGLSYTGGTSKELFLYHAQDPDDLDFTYILDWDGFSEYCHLMKELADAGCWSADVLNSNDERQTGLLTGRTASMVWNLGTCLTYAKQANSENPDWNVTLIDPMVDMAKKVNSYINNGVAINMNSNHKERLLFTAPPRHIRKTRCCAALCTPLCGVRFAHGVEFLLRSQI